MCIHVGTCVHDIVYTYLSVPVCMCVHVYMYVHNDMCVYNVYVYNQEFVWTHYYTPLRLHTSVIGYQNSYAWKDRVQYSVRGVV